MRYVLFWSEPILGLVESSFICLRNWSEIYLVPATGKRPGGGLPEDGLSRETKVCVIGWGFFLTLSQATISDAPAYLPSATFSLRLSMSCPNPQAQRAAVLGEIHREDAAKVGTCQELPLSAIRPGRLP